MRKAVQVDSVCASHLPLRTTLFPTTTWFPDLTIRLLAAFYLQGALCLSVRPLVSDSVAFKI
jgi:hypothetical protein